MDKRSIIAIAMVFVILFLWPLLFSNRKKNTAIPPPKEQQIVQKQEEKSKTDVTEPKSASNRIELAAGYNHNRTNTSLRGKTHLGWSQDR